MFRISLTSFLSGVRPHFLQSVAAGAVTSIALKALQTAAVRASTRLPILFRAGLLPNFALGALAYLAYQAYVNRGGPDGGDPLPLPDSPNHDTTRDGRLVGDDREEHNQQPDTSSGQTVTNTPSLAATSLLTSALTTQETNEQLPDGYMEVASECSTSAESSVLMEETPPNLENLGGEPVGAGTQETQDLAVLADTMKQALEESKRRRVEVTQTSKQAEGVTPKLTASAEPAEPPEPQTLAKASPRAKVVSASAKPEQVYNPQAMMASTNPLPIFSQVADLFVEELKLLTQYGVLVTQEFIDGLRVIPTFADRAQALQVAQSQTMPSASNLLAIGSGSTRARDYEDIGMKYAGEPTKLSRPEPPKIPTGEDHFANYEAFQDWLLEIDTSQKLNTFIRSYNGDLNKAWIEVLTKLQGLSYSDLCAAFDDDADTKHLHTFLVGFLSQRNETNRKVWDHISENISAYTGLINCLIYLEPPAAGIKENLFFHLRRVIDRKALYYLNEEFFWQYQSRIDCSQDEDAWVYAPQRIAFYKGDGRLGKPYKTAENPWAKDYFGACLSALGIELSDGQPVTAGEQEKAFYRDTIFPLWLLTKEGQKAFRNVLLSSKDPKTDKLVEMGLQCLINFAKEPQAQKSRKREASHNEALVAAEATGQSLAEVHNRPVFTQSVNEQKVYQLEDFVDKLFCNAFLQSRTPRLMHLLYGHPALLNLWIRIWGPMHVGQFQADYYEVAFRHLAPLIAQVFRWHPIESIQKLKILPPDVAFRVIVAMPFSETFAKKLQEEGLLPETLTPQTFKKLQDVQIVGRGALIAEADAALEETEQEFQRRLIKGASEVSDEEKLSRPRVFYEDNPYMLDWLKYFSGVGGNMTDSSCEDNIEMDRLIKEGKLSFGDDIVRRVLQNICDTLEISIAQLGADTSKPSLLKSLKRAYNRAARKYHPDRHRGQGEEAIAQAATRFMACEQAYRRGQEIINSLQEHAASGQ